MGLWDKTNAKPDSWWERKTSKEDQFAKNRRNLRECGSTTGVAMPTSGRQPSERLTGKEKRQAEKYLRQGKSKRGKKG